MSWPELLWQHVWLPFHYTNALLEPSTSAQGFWFSRSVVGYTSSLGSSDAVNYGCHSSPWLYIWPDHKWLEKIQCFFVWLYSHPPHQHIAGTPLNFCIFKTLRKNGYVAPAATTKQILLSSVSEIPSQTQSRELASHVLIWDPGWGSSHHFKY